MLQLKNIVKTYKTGELTQDALRGVCIAFGENEFVSILGQSGSGKTTMLNIIGGLDRYTSGDLIIDGVSTREYRDSDWDRYRNNTIGFVFQSYNLIPHQSVLSNVEMALTLTGVSKKERRRRALVVLEKVGLADHVHKKPNQMSGGQMQRVAIARALINDPDILLADEPTGALDSETSVQIMELLREIAKDKLVIMVTHNPELAAEYSTRIVRLRDGEIVDDSDPYTTPREEHAKPKVKAKKVSMSFFTALSLSFNNLRTKKGRTLLTSFAGSIGIIGIALILALSTGMNAYIANVQKDTMASYPITISSQTIDMSGIMGVRAEVIGERRGDDDDTSPRDGVFADYSELKTTQMVTSSIVENDLTGFKRYLDDPTSEIHAYLGENGIVYSYDVGFDVYSRDADGTLVSCDGSVDGSGAVSSGGVGILGKIGVTGSSGSGAAAGFSELMAGADGSAVSAVITESYDLLWGAWPQSYDEVILVLDQNNKISAADLYRLGLITRAQYNSAAERIKAGGDAENIELSYDDVGAHRLYLIPACDRYEENANGVFSYIDDSVTNEEKLMAAALELKIVGIVRPLDDASNADIGTTVGYTAALTDHIIKHTGESAVVKAQLADPEINVLSGMRFESADDDEKIEDAKKYLSALSVSEKASFYKLMLYYSGNSTAASAAPAAGAYAAVGGAAMTDEASMAAALDSWLAAAPNDEILLRVYDEYVAGGSFEDNLEAFGSVSYDAPSSISIYTDSFENKDAIAQCIAAYNETVGDDERITYTDYVAMLTSSLTTIINGISYVLVAFVGISLVVSCIMIGIITHISVMERTKEIGILRALGASKRNISQVFNAETFIIGCCSGMIGIGVSLLALGPINNIIEKLSGLADLEAQLPVSSSLILIAVSIVITIIGGLLPARGAAKKDPVVALRTE